MSHVLVDVPGVGPSTAEILVTNNIDTVEKLSKIDIKELILVPGIGEITGLKMIEAAKGLFVTSSPKKKDNEGKKDKKKGGKNKKDKKDKKKDKKKGKDKKKNREKNRDKKKK